MKNEVPEAFRPENNPNDVFSEKSAFWMNNFVANMVYPRYSAMIGDLRQVQQELEDFYASEQDAVVEAVAGLTPRETVAYLTQKSAAYTKLMMQRWDALARLLIVKHNDQIMKPSKDGRIVPGRYTEPGFDQQFYDAISRDTGDRYKSKTGNAKDLNRLNDVL